MRHCIYDLLASIRKLVNVCLNLWAFYSTSYSETFCSYHISNDTTNRQTKHPNNTYFKQKLRSQLLNTTILIINVQGIEYSTFENVIMHDFHFCFLKP